MGEHGLQLAIPKTEIVLLTRRRVSTDIVINLDDGGNPHTIQAKTSVKYLGVLFDNKLNFGEHFQKSCERAASVASSLSRLMANIGGPKQEMLRSPENWDKVAEYVRATLLAKKEGFLS